MCPVSYADPLLLIERCIVIYTGLVVFQGSLQGETAVPPASCLERENGGERKVLSVIPVLPVVDGFQTVGIQVNGLHEVVGCIAVTCLKNVFAFQYVGQVDVVIGVGTKERIAQTFVVTVQVAGGATQCPVIGIGLVGAERQLENVGGRRHVVQLEGRIDSPFPVILHLVVFQCGRGTQGPLGVERLVESGVDVIGVFTDTAVQVIALHFRQIIVLGVPVVDVGKRSPVVQCPVLWQCVMLVGVDFPAVNMLVGTAYEAGFYLFRTTVEKVLRIGRGKIRVVGSCLESESGGIIQCGIVHLVVSLGMIE